MEAASPAQFRQTGGGSVVPLTRAAGLYDASAPSLTTRPRSQRNYIGTTSLDAELSLLMANLARVRSGHFVYDPYCGTAGALVTHDLRSVRRHRTRRLRQPELPRGSVVAPVR